MQNLATPAPWPYPRWIAHRGAGRLAPENTLAAFRVGAAHGYRMYECDVKLSADDVPFLLHDATLERTSNGQGIAGAQPWAVLSRLDAGSWHSQAHAGEPLPTLEAVARHCLDLGHQLNIELKPTPGTERHTGEVVAATADRLWRGQECLPLLTSFQPDALRGARAGASHLPRGLLLDALEHDGLEQARALGCIAVVCAYRLWDADLIARARAAGLHCLAYTVNDPDAAQRLLTLGLEGIITDRVDLFAPTA